MANEDEQDAEKPDGLERFKKTNLGRLPTMEELSRAASAPHDADVGFLKYLSLHPSIVGWLETMDEMVRADAPPAEWKPEPKSLMERIKEELEKRKRQGEKGGELLS
jgi:hypothetical protein